MGQNATRDDQPPWSSCFLTDILISYMEEIGQGKTPIDYASLFRGAEGLEIPPDPERFLRDSNNWVPRSVLRELHLQCERIAGQKDFAYNAARAYFDRGTREPLSLFEVIFRVLNDVRSVLISSSLWASVQTNYLKLQSFETQGAPAQIHMLAQFSQKARPGLGSIDFLRGIAEGFPRLYSFIQEVRCTEEISQVRIEDILEGFPDFAMSTEEGQVAIRHRLKNQLIVQARKICLRPEVIMLSRDFWVDMVESAVVRSADGRIAVLTNQEDTETEVRADAVWAYKIVKPGVLSFKGIDYPFEKDQVFNAPYSRFRLQWKEQAAPREAVTVDTVRREVSRLLFEQLKQIKQTQVRMVQYHIEKRSLALENIRLRREIEREYGFAGILGQSPKMQELFGVIRSLAETDVVVLIQGETGTGKELIARAIHYNSPRRGKRFVAVNCGALVETLLESELFGHEKGAFTGAATRRSGVFEVADGGTLFLDEIGEISPSTQVRLLRVLQEGEFQRVGGTAPIRVDVRVLSATNQDLEDLVRKGRFRQDLYYRLNVFPIRVPPLRERAEDIPLLVAHFVEQCNQRLKRRVSGVSPQAMALLMAYSWPGNVREVENTVQRMMVVAKGDTLEAPDLPPEIGGGEKPPRESATDLKGITRGSAEIVEKEAIQHALAETGGNVTRAARSLGISRATLQKKMKAYGLRGPRG